MGLASSASTRWIAIVVGIIVILGIVWIVNQNRGEKGPSEPVSGLALVAEAKSPEGDVKLLRGSEELTVEDGTILVGNDIIRTGEGSVSLEFFAGSRVALNAHTQLRIDTANVNKANQRDQRVEITVLTGRVWSRVLKLLEVDSSFKARGGNITATVRGTAFMLTVRPGVAGNDATLDLFEGQLDIEGAFNGILKEGFTLDRSQVIPTPDETRNDPWVQAQLTEDKAFIERVSGTRDHMGDDTSYNAVGDETGSFTLDQGGHRYQYLEIRKDGSARGLQGFKAIAHIEKDGVLQEEDVTSRATWQVSDASLAHVSQDGTLDTVPGKTGTFTVVARWNDGTHEHSAATSITLTAPIE